VPAEPVLYSAKPRNGSKVGTITLPTLDLSWPIFEGTSDHQLARGVGHYRGSVLPGMPDNSVLSGHRTTVFNRLGELKVGDAILVKTSAGTFTYQVRSFRIVKRTNRTVIVPTDTAVLTVTTCYPFNNIGVTDHAFVVSADLIDSQLTG
jgi:sortase A